MARTHLGDVQDNPRVIVLGTIGERTIRLTFIICALNFYLVITRLNM